MNSVFSAFKSNKGGGTHNGPTTLNSTLSSTTSSSSSDSKKSASNNKKTLNLNETNNYEKLRHIREKMSNLMIDDDEINLRKPPCSIPIAPIDLTLDECDSMLPPVKPKSASTTTSSLSSLSSKVNGFDCIDSATMNGTVVNGNGVCINNNNHKNYASGSLSTIKKHYNQDNSENYASENNLLSKCCNGGGKAMVMSMGSDVSIADANGDVNNSASASSLISIKSMPLTNSNEASRSALTIYNKQPQSNRNRPRLSLSNANCNGSSSSASSTAVNCNISNSSQQPAVHGRNSSNGLPTGQTRTRLSTHQRNLSLDFR